MDRFSSVYGRPLVRGLDVSPEKALRRVKASVLARLRQRLLQSTFSDRAKRAFAKAIVVEVKESSLTIYSSHPGFTNMMRGRKHRQMIWLVKARAPIPIITEEGELIFRTATAKSMRDGKWMHPGRGPHDFVDKAKEEAKKQIRKALVREVRQVVAKAARNGRIRL